MRELYRRGVRKLCGRRVGSNGKEERGKSEGKGRNIIV